VDSSSRLRGLRVRRLEPEDWRSYRDVRLAALIDTPRAFWTTYAQAAALVEDDWRDRLGWPTWMAYAPISPDEQRPDAPVGLVALWRVPDSSDDRIHITQMWVAGWARGRGVADALIEAAVEAAQADGWGAVALEVAEENVRAERCYHRLGFRRTGAEAAMPWDPGVVEVEMVRPLGGP
jgi:ribosomal protein S18 acetylase RimI-like enzyme